MANGVWPYILFIIVKLGLIRLVRILFHCTTRNVRQKLLYNLLIINGNKFIVPSPKCAFEMCDNKNRTT